MAITDIISEEEISTPNMEVAQGGPEDFMTDDEMDPYQDPEFQQLLESLPTEQAEVLMQLIKEFKAMVAQGFEGEFEDFVKMKMASAQGGPEEFMSEEEMQIGPEEQQSLIPMGQQVAQGGRIGYQNAGLVGGIMDVAVEEQVETGPTNQEIIMKWLNDRGLPITPENIQRAIMELSREGQGPSMPRGQMQMPQMEMPRPPSGAGYVPEELIGQDISETVTPDVANIIPRAKPEVDEEVFSDQEMIDMKQDYIDKGGTFDKASWGIEDEVDDTGIMQIDDSITYTDEDAIQWRQELDRIIKTKGATGPDNYLLRKDDKMKEGVNKGFISEEDYLNKWQMPFFGRRGEQLTGEIDRYRDWAFGDDNYAQGGRAGYGLGSLVKSVFKGAKKGVKSLVKSVKKFAKSDLGKAALMYIATAGLGNIGAAGGFGKASWASPFAKGTGWLRPSSVMGNLGKSWGNIGKAFKGGQTDKLVSGTDWRKNIKIPGVTTSYDKPASLVSNLVGSFKDHPMPWILGSSLGAGLYTKMNPGDDNLDNLMRDYKGEVADWDQRMADIRAGKIKTPFSTDNITYPYPDYSQYSAEGGRIGRAEGGLMDLGGMEKDYRAEGGFVPIGGKEKADDVPARLSRNEFVFTADAVRNAGGGDVDQGSEVMQNIMTNLENGGSISEESQGLEGARDMFEVSERLSEVV